MNDEPENRGCAIEMARVARQGVPFPRHADDRRPYDLR
jgi:hypothetical protein